LDRNRDRIEARFDRKADMARKAGKHSLANKMERKGDRINRELDKRGDRIDRRLDRTGD
jgi:hypothetical protein